MDEKSVKIIFVFNNLEWSYISESFNNWYY
nr:MAG TPA: hypothetical protein [Caudoviricetes sp.]